jgi:PKD repeat protein
VRTLRLVTIMGSTPVGMRRLVTLVAVLALAACSLDKQTAPPLAGPSELGLSLAVEVTPDIITQDGVSVATVTVKAKDATGQPRHEPLTIRAETFVGGAPVDIGELSTKVANIDTATGEVRLTYRAPSAPPPTQASDTVVTIRVTPVGSNYAGSVSRQVDLRLARPGVIRPPSSGPVPNFYFSPTAPREDDDVFFDGSASTGSIVSYTWSFGDGRSSTSSSPTVRHNYGLAGTYSVVLTVTDDAGRSVSSAPKELTIGTAAAPTAVLTASPADPIPNAVVALNGSASSVPTGRSIVEYLWDLGDGTPPFVGGPAVAHRYPVAGTYTVVLRVKDDAGRTAVASVVITVAVPAP